MPILHARNASHDGKDRPHGRPNLKASSLKSAHFRPPGKSFGEGEPRRSDTRSQCMIVGARNTVWWERWGRSCRYGQKHGEP
jgi:hypothetical protein